MPRQYNPDEVLERYNNLPDDVKKLVAGPNDGITDEEWNQLPKDEQMDYVRTPFNRHLPTFGGFIRHRTNYINKCLLKIEQDPDINPRNLEYNDWGRRSGNIPVEQIDFMYLNM